MKERALRIATPLLDAQGNSERREVAGLRAAAPRKVDDYTTPTAQILSEEHTTEYVGRVEARTPKSQRSQQRDLSMTTA